MDFEKAFEHFLDRREYDQAENALFSMVRIAFAAGWKAADGSPVKAQKVLELKHKNVASLPVTIETDILQSQEKGCSGGTETEKTTIP